MQFRIHKKENLYFTIMATISLLFYSICWYAVLSAAMTLAHKPEILIKLALIIGVLAVLRSLGALFFIGYLRGHAIRVNERQFPELYEDLQAHTKQLALTTQPTMYILQGNGFLNAFALRFFKHNYVVLYSDIADVAYQGTAEGKAAVSFIIGHELGHIKRGHTGALKTLLLLPARFIPLLGNAYSRACEYTCDNIGAALCPHGSLNGLLLLTAGKQLYGKVNARELVTTSAHEPWFTRTLFELFSTHPQLVKRIAALSTHLPESTPQ